MRPGDDEPVRWRESSMDPRALTARAADLMDAGRDVPPLSSHTLARIEGHILAQRPRHGARPLSLGLRFAVLTAVVLASVATAKGTMLLWRRYVAAPAPSLAPAPVAPAARRRIPSSAGVDVTEPAAAPVIEPVVDPVAAPLAPAPVIARAPGPPRQHRLATASARAPRPAVPAAGARPDDAPSEAQLLAGALSRLRQARDPRGALALLDQYASTFPRGVLASEALSARLEAVLELDDRKGALELLDGRRAFAGRLGAEQLLTRAELRASAGRYADALGDFERLLGALAGVASPTGLERALYGRAVSLGHLGRDDQARADLVAYQKAFPRGKHAAEVTRLLKNASTGP
jgi:hypothetical protein